MEPSSEIPLTVLLSRVGFDEGDGERERVQPQQAEGEPQRHPQVLSAAAHCVCVCVWIQNFRARSCRKGTEKFSHNGGSGGSE